MKALVAQELNGPSGLLYTDVDEPAGGPDSVVVDVRAAGVCFPDLLLISGQYQLKLDPPFIPGTEVAGVVRSAPEGDRSEATCTATISARRGPHRAGGSCRWQGVRQSRSGASASAAIL